MNSNFVLVWINSFGTSLQLVSHHSSLFGSQLDPPLVKIIYHMYKQNNQSHFREQWCHNNTTLTLVGYSATFSPSWTLMTGIQQLIPIRNKLSTRFFPAHSALSLKGLETKLSYLCHLVCSKLALWLMVYLLSPAHVPTGNPSSGNTVADVSRQKRPSRKTPKGQTLKEADAAW